MIILSKKPLQEHHDSLARHLGNHILLKVTFEIIYYIPQKSKVVREYIILQFQPTTYKGDLPTLRAPKWIVLRNYIYD
jgi:hypothetical protein